VPYDTGSDADIQAAAQKCLYAHNLIFPQDAPLWKYCSYPGTPST
jgi:hypothetical protein